MENKENTVVDEELEGGNIEISVSNEEMIYPAEVRIEKAQYSISHMYKLKTKRNQLVLNPDYQRNEVWDKKQKSELIESILMGIPIPIIYLFEDQYGKWQVVDGRQRLSSMFDFLEGKWKLQDLKILKSINGKDFKSLDPKMQGIFEDFQLFNYVIQPPTPERIKYDIFDRVNRGGTRLNKQEMRKALYGGRSVYLLNEICETIEFINATGGAISKKRMKDQYTILRVFAFLMLRTGALDSEADLKFKGDIDDFLAKFMKYLNDKASEELIFEYKTLLLRALERSYEVLGGDGFRFEGGAVRRPINMPLMEALVYYFAKKVDISDVDSILITIKELKSKYDTSKYFSGNVDSTTSVEYRFGEIDNLKL